MQPDKMKILRDVEIDEETNIGTLVTETSLLKSLGSAIVSCTRFRSRCGISDEIVIRFVVVLKIALNVM